LLGRTDRDQQCEGHKEYSEIGHLYMLAEGCYSIHSVPCCGAHDWKVDENGNEH